MTIASRTKPNLKLDRHAVMQLLGLEDVDDPASLDDIDLPFSITSDDLDLIKQTNIALARDDFWAFRQYIKPDMLTPWWQKVVAANLMDFRDAFVNGCRPKILLQSPSQHGKSEQMLHFTAWMLGNNPSLRVIYASYGDALGTRFNLALQRLLMHPRYQEVFPHIQIGKIGWVCNTNFIELVDQEGSFRNTTVGGGITGQGLDIGIVDDPVKGRAEASSKNQRDKTWSWFTDDFFSRFSNQAGVCEIQTRWHCDDVAGRWMERFPETNVLKFKAIATEDERFRKKGEALFPELKPLDFLLERKLVLADSSWESLYQQSPYVVGGGLFPVEKLSVIAVQPSRNDILKSVRSWDKAGTESGGAYSAGVLMHKMKNGEFIVDHVVRGQWGALQREEQIKAWTQRDAVRCPNYEIVVEQEPGSGGKESAEATIRNLAGYRVFADRVTGKKEIRAEPFAAQVQGSNVRLVAGTWVPEFLDELESFPNSKYKDQTDASSSAFARLTGGSSYSLDSGWLD